MSEHQSTQARKVQIQARVTECLEQSLRDYSLEQMGEENVSWAVRRILEDWATRRREQHG